LARRSRHPKAIFALYTKARSGPKSGRKVGGRCHPACSCELSAGGCRHRCEGSSRDLAPAGPLGSLPSDTLPRAPCVLPRGCQEPCGWAFSTFFFYSNVNMYAASEEGEKNRFRSYGHFNKRLTLSASSFKSVKLLLCLIINICVAFRTQRFQTSQCLKSSRLHVDDLKLRAVFMHRTLGEGKIENIPGNGVFQG